MTWLKLPQEYTDRTEVYAAGRDAMWLHTAALVFCARHLTDGEVPEVAIFSLAMGPDGPQLAQRLIDVGLWYKTVNGYYIPEYLLHNPSRAQKDGLTKSRVEPGRLGGIKSGETRRANAEAKSKQLASNRSKDEAKPEASGEARIPYSVSSSPSPVDRPPSPTSLPSERGGNVAPRLLAHTHDDGKPRLAVAPKRDERWHAIDRGLTEGTGVEPQTDDERLTRARCVDQLHTVSPPQGEEEVIAACRGYADTWPHLTLSDRAIVKNYARFKPGGNVRTNGGSRSRAPTGDRYDYDAALRESNEPARKRQPDAIDTTFTTRRQASD